MKALDRFAERVDRDTGVRERVGFADFGDELLSVALHLPPSPVGRGVICSSVGNDLFRLYRAEVVTARALAARGIAVARFHYRGTGNSDGNDSVLTFASMVEDAIAVGGLLADEVPGVPMLTMGTRFSGPIAAASAAATAPDGPLVLVEPTLEYKRYYRDAMRARKVASVAGETDTHPSTPDPEPGFDDIGSRGSVDVLGYLYSQNLYDSTIARNLVDELGTGNGPILLVQFAARNDLRADLQRVADTVDARSRTVDFATVPAKESWWYLGDRAFDAADLTDAIAAWVPSALLNAGVSWS